MSATEQTQPSVEEQFENTMNTLKQKRKEHEDAIEEIDSVASKWGVDLKTDKRPGRKRPGATAGRKRKSFDKTGKQSIIDFVVARKKNHPTISDINQHWHSEGRAGRADTIVTKLVQDGQLERLESEEGTRGSRYAVATTKKQE